MKTIDYLREPYEISKGQILIFLVMCMTLVLVCINAQSISSESINFAYTYKNLYEDCQKSSAATEIEHAMPMEVMPLDMDGESFHALIAEALAKNATLQCSFCKCHIDGDKK